MRIQVASSIVLLGAGGFIGKSLAIKAAKKYRSVICISRSFQWLPPEHFDDVVIQICCAVSNIYLYQEFVKPHIPIIYMAGSTNLRKAELDPDLDYKIHADSLLNFLELLDKSNKIIYLSSGGTVYGEASEVPSKESDTLHPISAYGIRNMRLEELFLTFTSHHGFDSSLILRVANPFGIDQLHVRRKGLIMSLIESAFLGSNVTLRSGGSQKRDYIAISDLCELIFILLRFEHSSSIQILNACSGKSFTSKQISSIIYKFLNKKPSVIYSDDQEKFDVINSCLDDTLMRKILSNYGINHLMLPASESILKMDMSNLDRIFYQ